MSIAKFKSLLNAFGGRRNVFRPAAAGIRVVPINGGHAMIFLRVLFASATLAVISSTLAYGADPAGEQRAATIAAEVKGIATSTQTDNQKLAALHRLQSRHPSTFCWKLHNELRHMYAESDERASMGHCDIILKHSPNDRYILNILSNWNLGKDAMRAADALEAKAERYADLPHLVAACLTKARSLRRGS